MCFEDSFTKEDSVSDLIIKWMSNKGVCWTAPTTAGLLISFAVAGYEEYILK